MSELERDTCVVSTTISFYEHDNKPVIPMLVNLKFWKIQVLPDFITGVKATE